MRWSIFLYLISFLIAVLEVEIGEVEQTFHDAYDVYTVSVDESSLDQIISDFQKDCYASYTFSEFPVHCISKASLKCCKVYLAQLHPPDTKHRLILFSTFLI